jgi:tRNA(Ile)-lysidine synthase
VAQSLKERVLAYVRRHELLRPGDRLGVAVSGGADSVAALRLFLELRSALGLVLSVVHFNHQIRGAAADADERFVQDLAARFALDFHSRSGNAPACARQKHVSLETAARELRYAYFHDLCRGATVDKIVTAHTLDDQAETVLLRLLRGAWTRGLAGIYPAARLEDGQGRVCGAVVRPFLPVYRSELRSYLGTLDQDWREDASNSDLRHLRNRVRHQLLPLLARDFNPDILERLSELAAIAQTEEAYWQQRVGGALADVVHGGAGDPSRGGSGQRNHHESAVHLRIDELAELPVALQRRLVRQVTPEAMDFKHTQQVLDMILTPGANEVALRWPWRWRRVAKCPATATGAPNTRTGAELILECCDLAANDYEYPLPIPGEVYIPEIGGTLRARRVRQNKPPGPEYNLSDGLSAPALESCVPAGQSLELRVRNWRPGDRFWPVHTKAPKKVKELLQMRHLSGRQRAMWPVAVNSAGELVWLQGFGPSQRFNPGDQSGEIILIEVSGASPRRTAEDARLVPGGTTEETL